MPVMSETVGRQHIISMTSAQNKNIHPAATSDRFIPDEFGPVAPGFDVKQKSNGT